MSFQWTFLASFLYCELAMVILLLLPFISPVSWRKIFKSRIAARFSAGAKYYFNFIICIFGLLFFDSIRDLRKYSAAVTLNQNNPLALDHANMVNFRAQRNVYIAGFALFLWFVIKRLTTLLSDCAREIVDSAAARKQAEGAHRYTEAMLSKSADKNKDEKNTSSSNEALVEAEKQKYKQELAKAREEIEMLKERYASSVRDYDVLNEEHRKLQIKLAIASGSESTKDK